MQRQEVDETRVYSGGAWRSMGLVLMVLAMVLGSGMVGKTTQASAVPVAVVEGPNTTAKPFFWMGGTVTLAPLPGMADHGLEVLWHNEGKVAALGVVPGEPSPWPVVLRRSGDVLLIETSKENLWVARPKAWTLRRFADVNESDAAAATGTFSWGSAPGVVWWSVREKVDGKEYYPTYVQSVVDGRTVQATEPSLPLLARVSHGHVVLVGRQWHRILVDPVYDVSSAALYDPAEASFDKLAMPTVVSTYAPWWPLASVEATATSRSTSVSVFLTPVAYPLNSTLIESSVGLGGVWGGFGAQSTAPAFDRLYSVKALAHAHLARSIVGSAAVAASSVGNPGGVAEVRYRGWRIVVSCGPDNGNELAFAELLAVSLPEPPKWAESPVLSVCNAGDGEHTGIWAKVRNGGFWVNGGSYHYALEAIQLFQSLETTSGR